MFLRNHIWYNWILPRHSIYFNNCNKPMWLFINHSHTIHKIITILCCLSFVLVVNLGNIFWCQHPSSYWIPLADMMIIDSAKIWQIENLHFMHYEHIHNHSCAQIAILSFVPWLVLDRLHIIITIKLSNYYDVASLWYIYTYRTYYNFLTEACYCGTIFM